MFSHKENVKLKSGQKLGLLILDRKKHFLEINEVGPWDIHVELRGRFTLGVGPKLMCKWAEILASHWSKAILWAQPLYTRSRAQCNQNIFYIKTDKLLHGPNSIHWVHQIWNPKLWAWARVHISLKTVILLY